MIQYTLEVEGMQCGMCESHVNDAVRRAFRVKGRILSREEPDTDPGRRAAG